MKSKLFTLCFTLAALSVGTLFANTHPAPGKIGLSVDFLYLKPTFDDTYFVVKSGTPTDTLLNGERYNNDIEFKPGFRVGGVYAFCECNRELQVAYTWLGANQHRTISGTNLWATRGHPDFIVGGDFHDFTGSASSKLNLLYERVDANYAQLALDCCSMDVYFQFGLEYAFLRLNEHYTYDRPVIGAPLTVTAVAPATNVSPQTTNVAAATDPIGYVNQKSRSWGVGPQVGFEIDYQLTQMCSGNLSLNVVSSGSLLVGKSHTSESNSIAGGLTYVNIHDESTTRIIPALHTRVGLNYATCFSGCEASLELGYEFNSYLRGLARTEIGTAGVTNTSYYNFDVQGLYLSAMVAF